MKRIIISWIMISAIFLAAEVANATGEYICIDPGHGGPTAEKFGSNGDGAGTHGCCYFLSEQWVNRQVAYTLRDSLYHWSNCPMSYLHHWSSS